LANWAEGECAAREIVRKCLGCLADKGVVSSQNVGERGHGDDDNVSELAVVNDGDGRDQEYRAASRALFLLCRSPEPESRANVYRRAPTASDGPSVVVVIFRSDLSIIKSIIQILSPTESKRNHL
jgi:hypothetical protein